jgi:phosphoglycolate phosphatase
MGDAHFVGHLRTVSRTLIAFDLDGTLVDSRRDLAESANQLVVERGGVAHTEHAVGRMVGEGAALLVRRALEAAGLPDAPGALARFLEIYDQRLLEHTRPYPGIADVVRLARRFGRLALVTNKPLAPSLRLLDAFGLRTLFDDVVGGDGSYPRKPDPAALMALMAAAGASPERTLVIGDSAIDHETARRAGAACCLVSFGFGFENLPPQLRNAELCVADDVDSLRAVVERFGLATAGTGQRAT